MGFSVLNGSGNSNKISKMMDGSVLKGTGV
jgi:hypothetical protein